MLLHIILDGKSIAPTLLRKGRQETRPIGFVYRESHAIIDGKYKLLSIKDSTYLYNIYDDPGETTDLSQSHRKVLERLSLLYEKFIGSCKDSFDGKEYGTESVERMDQTWKY